jgi:hypothetical protein
MLHTDDLIEPRSEQILFSRRLVLLRPHRPLDAAGQSPFVLKGNPKMKLQASESLQFPNPCNLKPDLGRKSELACHWAAVAQAHLRAIRRRGV